MSRSMIQAAVTMNQLQQKLDVIGNNLANSQTTGYKSRQAEFSSLLTQQINNMTRPVEGEERLTPDGIRVGSGARLGSIMNDFSVGSISETGRALDVALQEKNHFFEIQVAENGTTETLYTRDGAFYLQPLENSDNVMLVTKAGHPVLGEAGPIIIEDGFEYIDIRENGEILIRRDNQTETAGVLSILETEYPQILEASGENIFRLPNLAELGYTFDEVINDVNAHYGLLKIGALERSNVDISKEMTDLLMAQRSYQMNARTITMGDQMMGLINQLR